jgi:hypothetical protein
LVTTISGHPTALKCGFVGLVFSFLAVAVVAVILILFLADALTAAGV